MDLICAGGGCRTTVRRNSDTYPFCSSCQEIRIHAYLREMKKIETAEKIVCYHCREEIYLTGKTWLHISTFMPHCQCVARPFNKWTDYPIFK